MNVLVYEFIYRIVQLFNVPISRVFGSHEELQEIIMSVAGQPGKALDLGCGDGRDAIFLNRLFRSTSNSETGEVDNNTVFHYRQEGDVVWATYKGGAICFGTLCGTVASDGALDFRYSHVNQEGDLMTGKCISVPEVLADGRLRLYETWQWTSGDYSKGESQIEEIVPE